MHIDHFRHRRSALQSIGRWGACLMTGALPLTVGCSEGYPPDYLKNPLQGPAAMTPDKAYALASAWTKFLREPLDSASFKLEQNGSFLAALGAMDFVYDARAKVLDVCRELVDVPVGHKTRPELAARQKLITEVEPYTLGGGQFFINQKILLNELESARNPAGLWRLSLRRQFLDAGIDKSQFVLELRWLNYWSLYFKGHAIVFPGSPTGFDRMYDATDAQLAASRPELERWAKKIWARGEPPV